MAQSEVASATEAAVDFLGRLLDDARTASQQKDSELAQRVAQMEDQARETADIELGKL